MRATQGCQETTMLYFDTHPVITKIYNLQHKHSDSYVTPLFAFQGLMGTLIPISTVYPSVSLDG